MADRINLRMIALSITVSCGAWGVSAPSCRAEEEFDDLVTITSEAYPELHLNQTTGTNNGPNADWGGRDNFTPSSWAVGVLGGSGNTGGHFYIRDRVRVPDDDPSNLPRGPVFTIERGAPQSAMRISKNGSIQLTGWSGIFGSPYSMPGQSRWKTLNLMANGGFSQSDNPFPDVASIIAQGKAGSHLHLVHGSAPAGQRVFRIQCSSGLASFHVVNDDLLTYAVANAMTIKMSNGNIGLRVANPTHPLQLASGARCTSGGVWTNASSRELKQDIEPLTSEQAQAAVQALQPVGYRYKSDPDERHVGFIAEDVPDIVATNDRQGLATMDLVAVLTKVVQDQNRVLNEERECNAREREKNSRQEKLIAEQQAAISLQRQLLESLNKRLVELEIKASLAE